MMAGSLVGILCFSTSSKMADREPTPEPGFLISFLSLLESFALMPVPQQTTGGG